MVHGTPLGAMLTQREAAGETGLVERVEKVGATRMADLGPGR